MSPSGRAVPQTRASDGEGQVRRTQPARFPPAPRPKLLLQPVFSDLCCRRRTLGALLQAEPGKHAIRLELPPSPSAPEPHVGLDRISMLCQDHPGRARLGAWSLREIFRVCPGRRFIGFLSLWSSGMPTSGSPMTATAQ